MFHAGAFHQLSRNLGLHGHEPGILYELHQLDDGLLTHYLSLYMNGGQGGRAYGGIGNIVKANQGYVIGNFVSLFLQSLHGAQGNGVVFRKKQEGSTGFRSSILKNRHGHPAWWVLHETHF